MIRDLLYFLIFWTTTFLFDLTHFPLSTKLLLIIRPLNLIRLILISKGSFNSFKGCSFMEHFTSYGFYICPYIRMMQRKQMQPLTPAELSGGCIYLAHSWTNCLPHYADGLGASWFLTFHLVPFHSRMTDEGNLCWKENISVFWCGTWPNCFHSVVCEEYKLTKVKEHISHSSSDPTRLNWDNINILLQSRQQNVKHHPSLCCMVKTFGIIKTRKEFKFIWPVVLSCEPNNFELSHE